MKKKTPTDNQINDLFLGEALKGNPFLVPEDYFSTLKKEITLKKNISELGETSFIVPTNYQENLKQDILSKVSESNLKNLIPNSNPVVPVGYFDDLQQRILNKTTKSDKASEKLKKTIDKKPIKQLGIYKWIPYVAAASIAIIIGLFAILEGTKLTTQQGINYSTQIDIVPTDDIINYLAFYSEVGDLEHISGQIQDQSNNFIEGLSSQEIETYLEYDL
jgi:hypothetical protein